MDGYSKVIMIGYLTKDATLATLPNGLLKTELRIAVNTTKTETCFVDVVTWGDIAKSVVHFKKGQQVFVEGKLKYETWKDKMTGQERSVHKIVATTCELVAEE